jgi:serine/threonine-protein kinase
MQPAPNLVIAERFRLNSLLGRGGMGSVWHATHLGLDIPCAVKFIEGPHAAMPEAHARFGREAKAAAQLRSPHVVQILDHGVWDGTPYMAMELLEGEDLGKRLARYGRMHAKDVCFIVAQVARALAKAHAAGIVHRDLKPDNIFLVRDDDREIAKVLDFGIAKATGAIDGSNTKTGAMLGTPYYMSPEQAQGTKAVDHRSDVWSLGVIVYLALTGQLPFESEALGDLLMKIMVSPMPVPSHVAPDLPLAFDAWWARAASRDPAQRFQSAKELSDALAMVFGQSQITDVIDRADMSAAARSSGVAPAAAAQMTPHPVSGSTPGTLPMTPALYQSAPDLVTGSSMARTYGPRPSVASKRGGLIAAIGGGVVLLCLTGVMVVVAVKAKDRPPVTASSAPTPVSPPEVSVALAAPPVASSPAPAAVSAGPAMASVSSDPTASRPPADARRPALPPVKPNNPEHPGKKPPPAATVDLGI